MLPLLVAVLTIFVAPAQSIGATVSSSARVRANSKIAALKAKRDMPQKRQIAADRLAAQRVGVVASALATPGPGGTPDYFGTTPNWAYTAPIRKFVDTLPGLGAASANNLGQYIPVGNPDTITYPGSDYYEIELRQYTEKMHSDLPPTTLRGYVQVNNGTGGTGQNTVAPAPIHYLGPLIAAQKGRPVRVKFTNKLPTGQAGNLFIPVDTTMMGAGMGPLGMSASPMDYTQNRATLHLHGGKTPWISDGTAHQWITPAGENTPYPKGVSAQNVPDMPDPGAGAMTFFYTNQQSARMMFYHDHALGITRLNVYAGEAAGYLIEDPAEKKLVTDGVIPADQVPLIIQDKSFVDANTIGTTDPTWNSGTTAPTPHTGDLWYPHVYMPNQNPYNLDGANAMGRWDYGPWFWPPTNEILYGPVPNPYYDAVNAPWEPPVKPGVPDVSSVMESFFDTPLVNGTAYPSVSVDPKSYRFRIINAANDRFWNLQLYQADPATSSADGRLNTEVKMVPASASATNFPAGWPTDGRDGGVPDPTTVGPDFIQIGTEGGFLPKPAIVKNQPVDWNRNMKDFTFGNVAKRALCLGPAERADVIVDFSAYAGQTLILYNDAPAAFPARDPRVDYYTGAADQTDTGGTTTPQVGYGPNTRTIMQIKVAASPVAPAFDMAKLEAAFASTPTTPGVFAASQNPILVGQAEYNSTYATSFPTIWPNWGFARIQDNSMNIRTTTGNTLTLPLQPKALHDEMGSAFDQYGRMSGKMGVELPYSTALTQNFVLQNYVDPATEVIKDSMVPMAPVAGDGTQIWKITHNGIDTHPIHFHLFDAQLLNRVGWDGAIRKPDPNELGWKDTIRINPLEDTIVALRPTSMNLPFKIGDSIRPLDPTMPIGSTMGFTNLDPNTGQPLATAVTNQVTNFGWEYMWHCHILSHEEMEMMRPIIFQVSPAPPTNLAGSALTGPTRASLTWTNNATSPAATNYLIQRATNSSFTGTVATFTVAATANTYVDTSVGSATYYYRVRAENANSYSVWSNVITLTTVTTGLTRYEQTDTRIAYRGSWATASNASYSGGTLKLARGAGTGFTVAFTGTAVDWIALTGPPYGIAQVTLDGVAQPDVDLFSATWRYRQVVFSKTGLAAGPHTLVVSWTGRKNASATSDYINLDAVGVIGTLTQAP